MSTAPPSTVFSANDYRFMRRALALARRGSGRTQPNPPVGAVLVKDNRMLSGGYHRRAGCPHAEIEAMQAAGAVSLKGCTLYVTLEPCNHAGRTAACTDAIISAGISRVVFSCPDQNANVAGKGKERLEKAGIVVEQGLLEAHARHLMRAWLHQLEHKTHYCSLLVQTSLDSRVGDLVRSAPNIPGAFTQRIRRRVDAVLFTDATAWSNACIKKLAAPNSEPMAILLICNEADRAVMVENPGLASAMDIPLHGEFAVVCTGMPQNEYVNLDGTYEDTASLLTDLFECLHRLGCMHLLLEISLSAAVSWLRRAACHELLLLRTTSPFLGEDTGPIFTLLQTKQLTATSSRKLGSDMLLEFSM